MKEAQFEAMLARWDKVLSDNDRIMGKPKPKVVSQKPSNVDETGYRHDAGFPAPEPRRRGW